MYGNSDKYETGRHRRVSKILFGDNNAENTYRYYLLLMCMNRYGSFG